MQSIGDKTLGAFLNADLSSFNSTQPRKRFKKSFSDMTNNSTHLKNNLACKEDTDLAQYFKDSIISFSKNPVSPRKSGTPKKFNSPRKPRSPKKISTQKPALDIVIETVKPNRVKERNNSDILKSTEDLNHIKKIQTPNDLGDKIESHCPIVKEVLDEPERLKELDDSGTDDMFNMSLELTRSRSNRNLKSQKLFRKANQLILNSDEKPKNDNPESLSLMTNSKENSVLVQRLSNQSSQDHIDIRISPTSSQLSIKSNESSDIRTLIKSPSIISSQDRLKLVYWGLPSTILRQYESRGLNSMFPWQLECLSNPDTMERYKNLVYSAPTSAGKTLVSEILIIKNIFERRKKVIFVLPFVSVVREKMYYFQDLLSETGVKVQGFMGGVHPPGGFAATDLAIATIEKANSLINQLMEEKGLETLGAVVIDELHLLGDSHRGYLLELLLTKLKYMTLKEEHVHIQLIGMSATLPNLSLLANWLDAELYKTDFRPVPLKELCKIGTTLYDNQLNSLRELYPHSELSTDPDNIIQLCLETVLDSHSVLIFCPSKQWCESLAQQVAGAFYKIGNQDTELGCNLRNQLSKDAIMETLEQLKRTPIGLDKVLRNTVSFGVAFHHAGLTMDERDVIEGAFRTGALRVLTATSTLSSGVNLPARRVIIRTPMFHGQVIDTLTYKQMIGRAGRMGKDTAGESILVCKPIEKNTVSNLLKSDLKPIESCLEGSRLLVRALLEAVASEVAYTINDIETYMRCTLLKFTSNTSLVEEMTKEAIEFLVKNELLLMQKSVDGICRWVATQLGKACLAASVPPTDGLFLFEELQKARRCFVLDTELHVIYLVTPFNSSNQIGQIDWYTFLEIWKNISESERRVGQLVGVSEAYLLSAVRCPPKPSKTLDIHKRFFSALALHDLVREVSLNVVCRKYDCVRGVIQSLQQTASTFAGMVTQFCKKLGWNCIELLVSQFQARLQFGVCRELLDLLRLPMLNGLRARSLFKEGITTVAELAIADAMDVERALYKALPFESEKEQFGEHESEAARRNEMRTVFVTGKDGLTPSEAAIMLVNEARALVQCELGLEQVQWDKKDQSRRATGLEVSKSLSGVNQISQLTEAVALSRANSALSSGSNVLENALIPCAQQEIQSQVMNSNRTQAENQEDDTEDDFVLLLNTPDVIEDITDDEEMNNDKKINQDKFKNEKIVQQIPKEIPETVTTPSSLITSTSNRRRSYSQSPSLFGDSLVLDTQECNLLDQNIIDLDGVVFDDIHFSAEQAAKAQKPETSMTKDKYNKPEELRNPETSSQSSFKSLVWNEDTWNSTRVGQDDNKRLQNQLDSFKNLTETTVEILRQENLKDCNQYGTPKRKRSTDSNSEKTPLDKLQRASKRKYSSPTAEKSPIASLITYDTNRRSSTGSNKSEDDIVSPSQTLEPFGTVQKNRTRIKMISMRSRTQKALRLGETSVVKLQSKNNVELNSIPTTSKANQIQVEVQVHNAAHSDDDDMFLCDDCSTANVAPILDKKIPKTTYVLTEKPVALKNKHNKIDDKKLLLKELSIVNISDRIKFNEFKFEIGGKEEIALALACEIFSYDTVGIGTKIINNEAYQDFKRRLKNTDGIYDDKKLCGVSITWGENIYYLPFENVRENNRVPVKERMSFLTELLSTKTLTVKCFQLKEIYKTLYKCCGLTPSCKFIDPTIANWLLNSDVTYNNFEELVKENLPESKIHLNNIKRTPNDIGPGMNVRSEVPSKIRACTEALLTWFLLDDLKKKLEAQDPVLLDTFKHVEMGVIPLLARMELTGLGINLEPLEELSKAILDEMSQLEKQAYSLAGKKFNFLSPRGVLEVLGLNKGKKVCANKAVLEQCDHPIAKMIIYWRKLNTIHIKNICPLLNNAKGSSRIHGNCCTTTVTGRIVMNEPNLQNVPRDFNAPDNSKLISIRTAFVSALDNVLLSADYCQLELRILAYLSKEPKLCSVLKKPGDVFKNIAARWYNTTESRVDDTMRQRAKQLCYGMIYGMGIKTLAETLQVDEAEAREFLETFMGAYPGIQKWLIEAVEEARKQGYVTTLMKRRRLLPDLNNESSGLKRQAERQAVNTKIQGSAADIAKKAMILIDERLRKEFPDMMMVFSGATAKRKLRRSRDTSPKGAYLVLHLHDELIYEVNVTNVDKVAKIVKESMEHAYSLSVPLPVKVKIGSTWGELKEYKFDT
ncbi:DNA polymerase theta isoform X1 [Microplitis demolitor]|uniref:DNA polymerase theta isoform X1 n=2 Tax=Microplitis demolitor TaxID=69319 RepID=UPI0004CCEB59|nr:DNA polymerase theta isoform X1 [Microplitis demolitor]